MKRLIITADDFGMSLEVNEAVEQAHREGILTCASLVVAGDAAEDAVRRAKRMPGLGVGLHLAMYGARASCPLPSPLSPDGRTLGIAAARTGAGVMLSASLRAAARREIAAQFAAYRQTGLPLGHLDGHWHCHQHPAFLSMAIAEGRALGLNRVRIPYEPYRFASAVGGASLARLGHALSHWSLAAMMRHQAQRAGLATNDVFFGKTDAGFISEELLTRLITKLQSGVTELGLHPSTAPPGGSFPLPAHWQPMAELAALTSPNLRRMIAKHGITLCRWADLP